MKKRNIKKSKGIYILKPVVTVNYAIIDFLNKKKGGKAKCGNAHRKEVGPHELVANNCNMAFGFYGRCPHGS